MGNRKSRRKGHGRHRRKHPVQLGNAGLASVEMEALEVALGFDGPLRGKPEPAIILAAFGVGPGETSLLGRALRRVRVPRVEPSTTPLSGGALQLMKFKVPAAYTHVVLVGLALEEDGGADVAELYASMSEPDAMLSWRLSEVVPVPVTLAEAARSLTVPPDARSVELSRDEEMVGAGCRSDEFIGAAIIVLDAGERHRSAWRMRFRSEDGRNDWTALLSVRV